MTTTRPGSYRPITIAEGVRTSMLRDPGKTALALSGQTLGFGQLVERMDRVGNLALHGLGLQHGDHAALMAPNCLEFVEIVAGLSSVGVAPAMVNPRLTGPELAYIANDSKARVLFVHHSLEELARATAMETVERIVVIGGDYEELLAQASPLRTVVAIDEWEPFCISYTAGTTGHPKGAMLSHRSRVLTFFGMAAEYGCYSPEDRALAVAPLYHGGGFAFAMAPVFFGGTCEILPRFDAELMLRIDSESRITNQFMVPTHFNAIFALEESVRARYDVSSMRTIISNAAPLPQATKQRIVEFWGEGILHETYGSTEGGIVTNLRPPDQLRKEQCVGQPFPVTEVRLLDEHGEEVPTGEVGELYSRSPYLFNGYWGMPEATADAFRDGWMSVGDMARKDDEGFIYIVDRKKDMIISGGVNIYPREIEEVLHLHPAVAEAAVVGVQDDYWGEAVKAIVALRADATASEDDLLDHCAQSLARYKLPKQLVFVDALPRNAAGKVLRRELR
ncbi:MAG: AMP-binding protein [Thermoleophilia bacterium]